MRLADIENHLRQVENGRREIVEQPKEHGVPPAITDLDIRHPDNRVARIDVGIVVQHVGEHFDGDGIAFARCAVDQFWRVNRTGSDKPAHRYGCADDVVTGYQIDDGVRFARDRAKEALINDVQ